MCMTGRFKPVSHAAPRRALLHEARVLVGYVLKAAPPSRLLCRYVRAVEGLDHGTTLNLPSWSASSPVLLAAIEPSSAKLGTRIAWAARISEADVAGSARVQPAADYQPMRALAVTAWAMMSSATALTARAALAPFTRGIGRTIDP